MPPSAPSSVHSALLSSYSRGKSHTPTDRLLVSRQVLLYPGWNRTKFPFLCFVLVRWNGIVLRTFIDLIFLNVIKYFWPCSNMQNYKVKYHFWQCSKIFDQVQKILNKAKKFWTWSKYFWTSRWNRHKVNFLGLGLG